MDWKAILVITSGILIALLTGRWWLPVWRGTELTGKVAGKDYLFNVSSSSDILAPSRVSAVSYRIAIMNRGTTLLDDQVQSAIHAFQTQIHEHFAPIWGIDADLIFVPKDAQPPENSWWLVILDESDQTRALS